MKHPVIFTMIAILAGAVGTVDAAEVGEVLKAAYQGKGPDSMQASMTMTMVDKGGKATDRGLQIRRVGNDKQLVWFDSPPAVAGTAFLRLVEEDAEKMWLYLPAYDKLDRIGATNENRSFLGSDFTYADMAPRRIQEFDSVISGQEQLDGQAVHKVTMTLTKGRNSAPYGKIEAFVTVDGNRLVREDLYDRKGDLVKRKVQSEFKDIEGFNIPLTIEMTDIARDHKTILKMADVQVNQAIDDKIFSTRYLKRLR